MKFRAAVIGSPIQHSKSPEIFAKLSKEHGMDLRYEKIEVLPDELSAFLRRLRTEPDFVGCNVTLPHKITALALVDEVTANAKACGAINVIHHRKGRLIGHNTDVLGIAACLENVKGITAVLFGAGGAARAAACVLGANGAREVLVSNRTAAKAQALCADFSKLYPKTRFVVDKSSQAPSLLINATSLGLTSATSPELPRDVAKHAIAFDFVYADEPTPFEKAAEARGMKTVSGKRLLLAQALGTWDIFFPKRSD